MPSVMSSMACQACPPLYNEAGGGILEELQQECQYEEKRRKKVKNGSNMERA